MDACINLEILKVIWFFIMMFDIVKIIIPIALIVLGIINFSKAVITNDEKLQKKSGSLFVKRLLYAILIFIVPWLVEVFIVTLGNLDVLKGDEINFTDCLDNANNKCIGALESEEPVIIEKECDIPADYFKNRGLYCWQCNDNNNIYKWGVSASDINCNSGWHTTDKRVADCK